MRQSTTARAFLSIPAGLVIILLWGLGSAARGSECLEASPTVQAGKNPYEPIAVRDLSPDEYKDLRALLESLTGEWQGSATEFMCTSFKDPADRKVDNFTLTAQAEVDYYGNFFLKLELYSPQKHSTRSKSMRLYIVERLLRINTQAGAGDVELIAVQDRHLRFLYRLLQPDAAGRGSIRKELFVELTAGADTFAVRQQIYSQGRLSAQQDWHFKRP